ncbi:HAD family hydrolase [Wenxinia marina]|uniref:phosphoglycolate phosphatase n=1 Tax=Wenxinia marina DSM 24838 TaxID=1123501 RepID=A0A0D0QFF4_9RHOB|nr:HAD family hydrolase [Wenxinia marina]KIQ69693.1 haloacid dehalogenase superfamily, subfamily IA [Wenxinia marina DSM 24838]GGL60447.1 phosphatase [Wenxinia marina]
MTAPGAGIRGLLFDKDGTLFDFQRTWGAWAVEAIAALSAGDPALEARIADILGFDRAEGRFRKGSIVIAETTPTIARHLAPVLPDAPDPGQLATRLDRIALGTPQVPACDLGPLFARLAGAGLALGLATNDSAAAAEGHLSTAGVRGAFGFVSGYDSGHGAKPGPGPARAFCAEAGLPPEAVAMVGDSLHDMECARAAGCVAIAVLTGPAEADTLGPASDAVLASIADLPHWLGLG